MLSSNCKESVVAVPPSDSASIEPAPNGGRVDIGLYGGTDQADLSPDAPQISDLLSWVNGPDVMVSLDAGTSSVSNWINLEYFNGTSFVAIPASSLTGDALVRGYRGARLATGLNRVITWHSGSALLPANENLRSIRVSLQRGADDVSATADICSHCVSIYDGTPTPTPTIMPTTTAQPTPTPQPSPTVVPPTPTSVPTSAPTIVPTTAPTAVPTKKPKKKVTPTPTPKPKVKPKKTPKPRVTPKPKPKKKTKARTHRK